MHLYRVSSILQSVYRYHVSLEHDEGSHSMTSEIWWVYGGFSQHDAWNVSIGRVLPTWRVFLTLYMMRWEGSPNMSVLFYIMSMDGSPNMTSVLNFVCVRRVLPTWRVFLTLYVSWEGSPNWGQPALLMRLKSSLQQTLQQMNNKQQTFNIKSKLRQIRTTSKVLST